MSLLTTTGDRLERSDGDHSGLRSEYEDFACEDAPSAGQHATPSGASLMIGSVFVSYQPLLSGRQCLIAS